MNQLRIKLPADIWVTATWDEYLQALAKLSAGITDPTNEKARGYYHDGKMRLEMVPLGHDHAYDNTIISFAISLFCTVKGIPVKGLTNCSYRKTGLNEAQPDMSYYIGENADVVPLGTTIIDLDKYPPPALAIEVASTSLSDDKGEKRLLYEDLGVAEYWIVDVQNVQIIAFGIANSGSKRIQQSQVLPDISIAILQEAFQRSRQTNQGQVFAWLMAQFYS